MLQVVSRFAGSDLSAHLRGRQTRPGVLGDPACFHQEKMLAIEAWRALSQPRTSPSLRRLAFQRDELEKWSRVAAEYSTWHFDRNLLSKWSKAGSGRPRKETGGRPRSSR